MTLNRINLQIEFLLLIGILLISSMLPKIQFNLDLKDPHRLLLQIKGVRGNNHAITASHDVMLLAKAPLCVALKSEEMNRRILQKVNGEEFESMQHMYLEIFV